MGTRTDGTWDGYGDRPVPTSISNSIPNAQNLYQNKDNGLGTFATYTSPTGDTVGLDQNAYNTMYGNQSYGGQLTLNNTLGTTNTPGMSTTDQLGLGLQGIGLGLNVYDYFTNQRPMADVAMKSAKQNYNYDKSRIADYTRHNDAMQKAGLKD